VVYSGKVSIRFIVIIVLFASIGMGCKPTRTLTSDQHLLQKNTLTLDSRAVDTKELEGYYRQKPNTRFLMFIKFRLAVYNFSHFGNERKWKNWLERMIGEPPVIFDSIYVNRTNQQFERFLKNEGYYKAQLSNETVLFDKKAWVTYKIKLNEPIVIKKTSFNILDSSIASIVLSDTSDMLLKPGNLFSLGNIEGERDRIVHQMRDSGYYEFNNDYIRIKVDTSNNQANVEVVVNKAVIKNEDKTITEAPHQKYWINKIFFLPDFDPQLTIRNRAVYFSIFDTLYQQGFGFIYPSDPNVKPKVLLKANSIEQGKLYSGTTVENTLNYLNSLRLFRLSSINFYKEPNNDTLINCNIQLTPATYQNFSVNFETTNTQGNFGLGGNFNYQHKNIFKGAEIFSLKFSGAFQRQAKSENYDAFNIIEYGAEAKLETPTFLLPIKLDRYYKTKNPKTYFSISHNFQQRPDYTRVINNASMGYQWKGSENVRHLVSPIDLSSVDVRGTNASFFDSIQANYPYLVNNYKNYFIAGGNYSFIYQNNTYEKGGNYQYFRWNFGLAGNLLHLYNTAIGSADTVKGGYYLVFNRQYAQYALTDVDYRYYYHLNIQNQLIGRVFAGLAFPYGNATAIPFVKQYFGGGAQGIRAWRPKDLGPGTYADSIASQYPNQMADVKFEMNLEYRFSYSKTMKGAFFLDAGNIWSINKDDPRTGAIFKLSEFYKQLALGTGFGLRLDLDFAVFRLDWGIPVRNPKYHGAESWVLFHKPLKFNDVVWNFAIGYPF